MKQGLWLIFAFFLVLSPPAFADGLEIRDIRVYVDYDEAYTYRLERKDRLSYETNILNGSSIRAEILPGSNVTFTFWLRNSFSSASNIDIKNAIPRILIEELDDGADVDWDGDEIDLEPGDDERIDVKFFIPIDVDATAYEVTIDAEGENNGTIYDTEIFLKMPIRKESHDIRISNAYASPGILQCSRKATINAEIVNAGANEENDVSLEFRADSLNLKEREDDIFLESSNEASIDEKSYKKSVELSLPQEVPEGRYSIFVNLYWKKIALFDQKKIDLIIKPCDPLAQNLSLSEDTDQNGVVINQTPIIDSDEETITQEINPRRSTLNSPLVVFAFGGAIIVFLIFFVVMAYRKNNSI